jgi:hypothetical protein
MRQIRKTDWDECWYCGEPVGLVGRFFSWLFGTRTHGCNFQNIKPD